MARQAKEDNAQEPDDEPDDRITRQVRLAGRMRRRAWLDMLVLVVAVSVGASGAASLGRTTHEALLFGLLATSVAILLFLHRRGRDLAAMVRADDWRAQAVEGRGISLAAWCAGDALPGWSERRDIA